MLVEFADFGCKYCERFATEVYPLVEERYVSTGRLRFGFKHLPLRSHPLAREEAVASECVAKQDPFAFWRIHDRLFADARRVHGIEDVYREIGVIGVAASEAKRCVAGRGGYASIQADIDEAHGLGLSGTPAFALGTVESDRVTILKTRTGFATFERLASWIDETLDGGTTTRVARP